MRKKFGDKFESWKWAFLNSIIFIALWLIIGLIGSNDLLDKVVPIEIKVADKDNILSYLAVILAIQIPVFILFLQEMSKAGFVRRKVLPRVTQFKEILILLVTGSTLILLSPRNGYLYFPLIVMIVLNIMAIFKAVQVTFHQEMYEENIRRQLKRTAKRAFTEMMDNRRQANKYFKKLETTSRVKYTYFEQEYNDSTVMKLQAKTSGVLEKIDVNRMLEILAKEFPVEESKEEIEEKKQNELPVVYIRTLPMSKLNVGDQFGSIVVPSEFKKPEKLLKKIYKCFDINPAGGKTPILNYFDEVLEDFRKSLFEAVKENDAAAVKQSLNDLREMLDALDTSIKEDDKKHKEKYGLDNAYNEFSAFINDDFSSHQKDIYEMLTELYLNSIIENKPDVAREFTRFLYGQVLSINEDSPMTSIARYDGALTYVAGQFIYDNPWNKSLTSEQQDIMLSIFHRIKEHTGILLFNIKEKSQEYDKDSTLEVLLENRLSRVRSLTLAAIKNKKDEPFKNLMKIFNDIDREDQNESLYEEDSMKFKCTVFLMAAYLKQAGQLDEPKGQQIMAIVEGWTDQQLTDVLIECKEKKYANNWHIETFDLPADGEFRSVPDYDRITKELWADVMASHFINNDPRLYGDKSKFEQTLLFTNGSSSSVNNDLFEYVTNMKSPFKEQLLELLNGFMEIRWNYENTKLANEPLDQDKVVSFVEAVNRTYTESSITNKVFKKQPELQIKSPGNGKGYKEFGINQIFDKEAFIKDWHSGYIVEPMADQLGRQIAQGSDREVFSKLLKKHTKHENLEELIGSLSKNTTWLVIANNVRSYELEPRQNALLDKKSSFTELYFKGIDQEFPVQHISSDDIPHGLYFIDQSQIGELTQANESTAPVGVNIDAYSEDEELLKGLIKSKPDWLTSKGSKVEQEKFLKTKVRMWVKYIFKYQAPDNGGDNHFVPRNSEKK